MEPNLRIGELSRRSGVSPELLRAWERRYGLLRPSRSPGRLRLYSLDDLDRVRRMRQHLAEGLAAAEAAALASRPDVAGPPAVDPVAARRELADALDTFDEPRAQTIIDGVLTAATVDMFVTEVVLPYLHELGDRWARGEASVAQEHFASGVLRARLLALARGWGRGFGPLALLACVPGERHDAGLLSFGLLLRSRGWRIAYLGADTPLATLESTARLLNPDLVVLAAVTRDRIRPHANELRELAKGHRLALGGAGASEKLARDLGALAVSTDPIAAADEVTAVLRDAPAA